MKSLAASVFSLATACALALPSSDAHGAPGALAAPMPATADDVASVLEKVGAEDRDAADRLSRLAIDARRIHALLLARGRSYVKLARAGLLPVGGGLDALVEHASKLERLRRSLSRDLDRERSIAEERLVLTRKRASLDERRGALETEHAALQRSHTAILAAEDREAAFRRAFLSGAEAASHTAVYGGGLGPEDPATLAGGFSAQKGRLPFPIEGRVEIRRVKRPAADGPGLEMVTRGGATVRAVYPGRVAFADTYADYGRAVIVDHGAGYYSVCANLGSIDVHVGDELGASDRVGTVAAGGTLYLEIRHGAETLNPASWFGI
ncbi:MAG TPA: peptidoglycan DD-metalloendopeptidase family protein [Polyangiaceae bacterium]|nr:peptidoglycan DD-metalloendopeptidase family protein [Polyangiaceae bacterium]